MLWGNQPSPCTPATEARTPRAPALQREANTMSSSCTAKQSSPPATTRESPCIATKTQHSHKEMKNRAQNPHDQPDQEMQKKHLPKFNAPHDEL